MNVPSAWALAIIISTWCWAPRPAGATSPPLAPPVDEPWRIHDAVGAPSWLGFGLEHRARFEHLEDDFRSTSTGDSRALSLRTQLSVRLGTSPLSIFAEAQDSRAYATDQTPLNTGVVDPVEILQAHVTLRGEGLLTSGDSASLTVGRFTMDLGSRRLVARNEFRNTINTFTGVDVRWTSPEQRSFRTFVMVPVRRLPADPASLARNRVELDVESTDTIFGGAYLTASALAGTQLEAYVFGLLERDGTDVPSSNRRISIPGLRVLRAPEAGQLDYQAEVTLQLGTSRDSSAPADTTDLTHRALAAHLTAGYRFDCAGVPRLALHYDFASGDAMPGDRLNGRFDPLFGARRFELGPTGIYGAFARSNISSPGLRVEVAPTRAIDAFASYRLYWLASARDAWTTAGVRDPTGASGRFIGHQLEGRIRWYVLPKNLTLEVGGTWLQRGALATQAPGGRETSPIFVYTQVTATI